MEVFYKKRVDLEHLKSESNTSVFEHIFYRTPPDNCSASIQARSQGRRGKEWERTPAYPN